MKLFRGIVLILLINYRSPQHHFKSNSKFMKNWKRWIAKTHILSARLRLVLWTVTRYMSRLTGGGERSTTGVVTTVGISSQWGGAMPVVTLYSPQDIKVGHYGDIIMSAMASQITSLTIVYSTVYSGANQRKHQSSAPLAFAPAKRASNVENVSIWWHR